jgi:hypothetical protein
VVIEVDGASTLQTSATKYATNGSRISDIAFCGFGIMMSYVTSRAFWKRLQPLWMPKLPLTRIADAIRPLPASGER